MSKIINFPAFRRTFAAMPTPAYDPDPRNGEVYATESYWCRYGDEEEIEEWAGFAVVHMSRSGDSASMERGFETLVAAEAFAVQEAIRRNAVYLPPKNGGK